MTFEDYGEVYTLKQLRWLVVLFLVASFGVTVLASDRVTSDTILYLTFDGEQGALIDSVTDAASGVEAVAVQFEPTQLTYGGRNPITGSGTAYFANPNTSNRNGSYLYIADTDTVDLAGLQALTLELYIRPETAKLAALLRKTEPGKETGYLLAMDADGRVIFQLNSGDVRQQIRTAPGVVAPQQWAHVAATWDGENMYIIVNDMIEAEGKFTATLVDTPGHLGIGALIRDTELTNWGQIFHGQMSDVRISKRALWPGSFVK